MQWAPAGWRYHRRSSGPRMIGQRNAESTRSDCRADPDDTADEAGARTYRTDGYAVFHAAAERLARYVRCPQDAGHGHRPDGDRAGRRRRR